MTRRAGLCDPRSKALGVALIDHNNDGWIDVVVANDTQPNRLWENRRDGTFVDVGTTAGSGVQRGRRRPRGHGD